MAKKGVPNFGGKKAAPFAKGGGRKKSSTKTAKGKPKRTSAMSPAPSGASPSTAIAGGRYKAKGKVRGSANAKPSMGGQAGMITANQAR